MPAQKAFPEPVMMATRAAPVSIFVEGGQQIRDHLRGDGVAFLGAVEGDGGDFAVDVRVEACRRLIL